MKRYVFYGNNLAKFCIYQTKRSEIHIMLIMHGKMYYKIYKSKSSKKWIGHTTKWTHSNSIFTFS